MKLISESHLSEFQLFRPDISKRYYEILGGNEKFVSIDFIHGDDTLARIETASDSFLIKRLGFFMPYVAIREEKSNNLITTSLLNVNAGSALALDGNHYLFAPLNLWKNQWGWVNDKNKPLVKYKLMIDGLLRGYVEVARESSYLPNIELITGIGAYFLVQLDSELSHSNEG